MWNISGTVGHWVFGTIDEGFFEKWVRQRCQLACGRQSPTAAWIPRTLQFLVCGRLFSLIHGSISASDVLEAIFPASRQRRKRVWQRLYARQRGLLP